MSINEIIKWLIVIALSVIALKRGIWTAVSIFIFGVVILYLIK